VFHLDSTSVMTSYTTSFCSLFTDHAAAAADFCYSELPHLSAAFSLIMYQQQQHDDDDQIIYASIIPATYILLVLLLLLLLLLLLVLMVLLQ
jgi:hypothetical protein